MDFSKAAMLLHVADKARQWPNLSKLEKAALAELEKIQNEEPQIEVTQTRAQAMAQRLYPSAVAQETPNGPNS